MTEVTIYENSQHQVTGFEADNHSGMAERGRDIVCAGISTIFEVALSGLSDLPTDCYNHARSEDDGAHWLITVSYPDLEQSTVGEVSRLLSACRDTLDNIADNYPDHCTIETTVNNRVT